MYNFHVRDSAKNYHSKAHNILLQRQCRWSYNDHLSVYSRINLEYNPRSPTYRGQSNLNSSGIGRRAVNCTQHAGMEITLTRFLFYRKDDAPFTYGEFPGESPAKPWTLFSRNKIKAARRLLKKGLVSAVSLRSFKRIDRCGEISIFTDFRSSLRK